MQYSINYDICAILLDIIVIILMLSKRRLPTSANRVFTLISVTLLTVAVLEIGFILIMRRVSELPSELTYAHVSLFLIAHCFIPFLLFVYVAALADRVKSLFSRPLTMLPSVLPLLTVTLLIVISAYNDTLFRIDESGYYVPRFGMYFVFGVAGYYFAAAIICGIINRKRYRRGTLAILAVTTVLLTVPAVYLMNTQNLMILQFASSVVLVLVNYFIQSPWNMLDFSTSLFNGDAFSSAAELNFRAEKSFSAIIIRYENAAFIEKTYGVDVQRQICKQLAAYVREALPKKGSGFVFSNDRFGIMLPEESRARLEPLAEKTLSDFADGIEIDGSRYPIKLYAQTIVCPDNASSTEALLDAIDLDLSVFGLGNKPLISGHAGFTGRNSRRVAIRQSLLTACEEKRILVVYQPIVSATDGRVVYVEALSRIYDDKLGYIMPDEFLPIAEKMGVINKLGAYVFEEVCTFLTSGGGDFGIRQFQINLSVVQCMDSELAAQLIGIADRYGVDKGLLNFEITEKTAMDTNDILMSNMRLLIGKGFSFTLDDYGIAYTNIKSLIDMPFSTVKIDRGFTWASASVNKARHILASTVEMLEKMNLTVIGEGIEEPRQAEMLAELGCTLHQGFYYSKPLELSKLKALLEKQRVSGVSERS